MKYISPYLYKVTCATCGGLSTLPIDMLQTKILTNSSINVNFNEFKYMFAMSNIFGLHTLGAEVMLCGPSHLIPKYISDFGVKITHNIDEALEWGDVINVLRIQRERMGIGLIPSTREYRDLFGITKERIKNLNKEIVIMHPGPINRGVEIDSYAADCDQSIILNQVLNGVAVRMSILYLLLGAKNEE